MKLYPFPAGRAVGVLALKNHLGLDCEVELLDFRRGDQLTPEYLALNPNKKMPTLEDDGFVLWESNAILFYMAAKHPEKGLWPSRRMSCVGWRGKAGIGMPSHEAWSHTRKPRKPCSASGPPTPLSLRAASRISPVSRPCSTTRWQARPGSLASGSRSRIFRSEWSLLQRTIWDFRSGTILKLLGGANDSLRYRAGPRTTPSSRIRGF
jgi:hypothetical protein